jgi:hypothetical protein
MGLNSVVRGHLKSDGTLELEQQPDLAPGPVQVTLQALTAAPHSARRLTDVLDEIHAAQRASGFQARSREAIDAEIQQMRAEWDDRREAMERGQAQGSRGGLTS